MIVSTPDTHRMRRLEGFGLPMFRIFLGVILLYGVQDNILDRGHMLEFRDFLAANGFVYPVFCAYLSVYTQAAAGLAFILGFQTRIAAALMVINFVVALVMVHVGLSFSANIAPLAMLFGSLLLLLDGPGGFSIDHRRTMRAPAEMTR